MSVSPKVFVIVDNDGVPRMSANSEPQAWQEIWLKRGLSNETIRECKAWYESRGYRCLEVAAWTGEKNVDLTEALDALASMVANACTIGGKLDSMFSATNAEAIQVLAKHGRVKITLQRGGFVEAEWCHAPQVEH